MSEAGDLESWQQCLHTASLSGEKAIVALVLSHAIVDVDMADAVTGVTALSLAASAGNLAIVDLLLDHGADINHQVPQCISSLTIPNSVMSTNIRTLRAPPLC